MSELRLIATISPQLYEEILSQTQDNYVLIRNIFDFCINLQHILVIYLPSDIIPFMNSSKRLKILYEKYEHGLYPNLWFKKTYPCSISLKTTNEEKITTISQNYLLAFIMRSGRLPFLFDKNTYLIKKEKCFSTNCNPLCAEEHNLLVVKIDEKTFEELQNNSILNIKEWCIKTNNYTIDDIKQIAIFYAFYFGATKEDFEKFNKVVILEQLLNDLKQISLNDFLSISYTIFRCSVFPPSNSSNANIKSVDWHKHKGIKFGENNLYRIDVVEPTKGKNSSSGKKRLFKIQKNDITYILKYDDSHGDSLTVDSFKERFKLCNKK